jgi:hypothetical protein
MIFSISDAPATRIGNARGAPCAAALAHLARHTSRDTVLIASSTTQPVRHGDATVGHLTGYDVDGLSTVVDHLGAKGLDLVLHGSGGGLEAAAEFVALLRGRYDSIRALVPEAALSALSLIAFVCDTIIMPESALLGVPQDSREPHIACGEAADWVARNGAHRNALNRIELATMVFDEDESSDGPITARHARDLGLQVHLVRDRSGIGSHLEAIGKPVEYTFRAEALVKLIENHQGGFYAVVS